MTGRKALAKAALGFLLALGAVPLAALADSIGPACSSSLGGSTSGDSGACLGSIYTLTSDFLSPDATTVVGGITYNTYDISLTVNTSGFLNGPAFIKAVSIGINGPAVAVALDSAPGGISGWSAMTGGQNVKGCDDHGLPNFVCAQLTSNSSPPDPTGQGNVYTWMFDVTIQGTLNPASGDVKALYLTPKLKNAGITSAPLTIQQGGQDSPTLTPVPEPGTIALVGSGLLALLVSRFRRKT